MTVPFDRMDCVYNTSPFQSGTFFLSEGRFQNCEDWFLSVADLEIVGAVKGRFLVYHQQAPTFRPEAGHHHTTVGGEVGILLL